MIGLLLMSITCADEYHLGKSKEELTKEMFGVSTQPRPNDWKPLFKELVEGYLDEVATA